MPTNTRSVQIQKHSKSEFSTQRLTVESSGQFIASSLLYVALVKILSTYRIVASEAELLNTDYVDYNQFKTALVAIPVDFKVRLVLRDEGRVTEGVLRSAEERTNRYYAEKE